jgi:hypothetical protein
VLQKFGRRNSGREKLWIEVECLKMRVCTVERVGGFTERDFTMLLQGEK